MAKYRHRTFEMFDFPDEATLALASKSTRTTTESDDPASWTFQQLTASRAASVTLVKFKKPKCSDAESEGELREDLSQLADLLVNDSRVLLDFEGLHEFSSSSIDALALFNRKLQSKGSRIALCNLEPAVQASFYPNRKEDARRN